MMDKDKGIAIILAAGAGGRFGGNKLATFIHGKSMIEYTISPYLEHKNIISNILVVINPSNIVLKEILEQLELTIVNNPDSKSGGMSSSIISALNALDKNQHNPRYAFIHPGDIPRVHQSDIWGLYKTFQHSNSDIVIPEYRGRKGHPLLISNKMFKFVKAINEDSMGLKGFLSENRNLIKYHPAHNSLIHEDVDTVEDMNRIFDLE